MVHILGRGGAGVSIQHQVRLCSGPETLVNPGVIKEYFVKRQQEHLQVHRESKCIKERWGKKLSSESPKQMGAPGFQGEQAMWVLSLYAEGLNTRLSQRKARVSDSMLPHLILRLR